MTSSTGSTARPRLGWLAVGAFAGLALAVAFGPALAMRPARAVDATTTTPEHTISVSGIGRVTTTPDVADVRVGVQVTRTKVRDAQSAAATAMAAVIAALKSAGVADKDIQTTALSLQPVYDYSNNGNAPRLTGYQIVNAVTATVRKLDTISDVIDGALAAGATTLDGITFRVDDPTSPEAQARDAAMKNARAKADALAKAAGVAITGVSSISEQSGPVPVPMPYFAAGGAKDAAAPSTPVQVGTNEVDVSVSVVYLID
jgi:uncharacterized protein YggE